MDINDNNDNDKTITGDDYDDGNCGQSSFNSVRVKHSTKKESKNLKFMRTITDLTKEFLVDYWRDATPNMRVSVQFQVESGDMAHENYDVRVSTDGLSLVVTKRSSKYMMDSIKALFQVLVERGIDESSVQMLMKHHPRVIARKESVSKITHRNTHKRYVDQEFRVALPFKCRHKITSSEDGDEYFYGLQYIRYGNGEIYGHVELIAAISDSYSADVIPPMFTDSMQMDDDEEYTTYTYMDEATVDRPNIDTAQATVQTRHSVESSSISKDTKSKKTKSNGSRASASRNSATKPPASRRSSSLTRKSSTPSKIRKSSTPSKMSPAKANSQNQIPPTVAIYHPPNEDEFTGPSFENAVVVVGEGSFMTANSDSRSIDNMSIDNSTIRTLDPYVYSKQGMNASSALTISCLASKD